MKNNDKLCATREGCAIELLSRQNTDGELRLELSLYRITLCGSDFYLAVSADAEKNAAPLQQVAAEVIGCDERRAEHLFRMLVEGSVPPSTLHEIVFDMLQGADLVPV